MQPLPIHSSTYHIVSVSFIIIAGVTWLLVSLAFVACLALTAGAPAPPKDGATEEDSSSPQGEQLEGLGRECQI